MAAERQKPMAAERLCEHTLRLARSLREVWRAHGRSRTRKPLAISPSLTSRRNGPTGEGMHMSGWDGERESSAEKGQAPSGNEWLGPLLWGLGFLAVAMGFTVAAAVDSDRKWFGV